MPAFHAASISTKMLKELGGATVSGPILVGLSHSVQICPLGAKDSDILPMAVLAACKSGREVQATPGTQIADALPSGPLYRVWVCGG